MFGESVLKATVYAVYLANIYFGKLERNANWWTFSLVNRAILIVHYCMTLYNTCNYESSVGVQ